MATLRVILIAIFLVSAIAMTVIVLLQEGKSAGLGSMGGGAGAGETYWDKNKKNSLEGKFERWTKITAVALVVTALLIMVIPSSNQSNAEIVLPTETTVPESSEAPTESTAPESSEAPTESTEPQSSDAPVESTNPESSEAE